MNNVNISYIDRKGLPIVTINSAKNIIKNSILYLLNELDNNKEISKITYNLIGSAGIGKTQIGFQIAKEISEITGKKFECILLKCPVLQRDDFLIPIPKIDGDSFKMLKSDFIPNDENSYGIIIVDEFSRGDYTLQQLLWQLFEEDKIHTFKIPKGWFIISTDNPEDENYQGIRKLEDAAGTRRQLHFFVETKVVEFINYAKLKEFHKLIIEFIQTNPTLLYDYKSQNIGRIYACPASWEKLSSLLKMFENIDASLNEIEILAAGLINTEMSKIFIDFIKEKISIRPEDFINNYKKISYIIDNILKNGDLIRLNGFVEQVTNHLIENNISLDKNQKENISDFFESLPDDIGMAFFTRYIKNETNEKTKKYLQNLMITLIKNRESFKLKYQTKLIKMTKG